MSEDKFQILREFAKSNEKPDKTIYEYIKEVLDVNSAYAKENQKYKEVIDKAIAYIQETDCVTWDNSSHEDLLSILKEVE